MTYPRFQTVVLPLLGAFAFALLTAPTWRWLWGEWMSNDYYSHGILIPPVAAYLAYQRIRRDESFRWQPGRGMAWALLLVAVSLAAYLWFFRDKAYYLAAFAMIPLLAGLVWLFGGGGAARRLIFPLAYLAFMVPLPFIDRYTLPLALFTGVCSGALVRFLGLDVNITGNAVTLPNADLVIGAQCSGVNSLIALLALLAVVAYIVDGPPWARITLVLLAVPLALLGNILRVASLLFVAREWGAQAAFTFYHDYSGIAFFVAVLLLLYPLVSLLRCGQLRSNVI
jgi:exosortase